jgi:hypothetical protein
MSNILVGIDILWVGGVIAVVALRIIMKRKLHKKNKEERTGKAAMKIAEGLKSDQRRRCEGAKISWMSSSRPRCGRSRQLNVCLSKPLGNIDVRQ